MLLMLMEQIIKTEFTPPLSTKKGGLLSALSISSAILRLTSYRSRQWPMQGYRLPLRRALRGSYHLEMMSPSSAKTSGVVGYCICFNR
ncbi:hypothetical protein O9992_01350 [Vibrio lentus]|nr:hypothetical protein [Vibrio lentus]